MHLAVARRPPWRECFRRQLQCNITRETAWTPCSVLGDETGNLKSSALAITCPDNIYCRSHSGSGILSTRIDTTGSASDGLVRIVVGSALFRGEHENVSSVAEQSAFRGPTHASKILVVVRTDTSKQKDQRCDDFVKQQLSERDAVTDLSEH